MTAHARAIVVATSVAVILAAALVTLLKLEGTSSSPVATHIASPLPAPITTNTPTDPVPTTPAAPASAPSSPPVKRAQAPRWIDNAALRADVDQISGGQVGVAVVPLGVGRSFTAGPEQVGAGWSTMKIPVIIARYRLAETTSEPFSQLTDRVTQAITASDNAAVMSLFNDLETRDGGLAAASLDVQQVLRDAGDPTTTVNTLQPAGGYSTFGQTQWPLLAGTRFFQALADGCIEPRQAAQLVINLMGQVTSSQRWGLGQADFHGATAYFKGGWGPDSSGAYLVRQFGIIADQAGHGFAVGVIAKPADASFASGVAILDQLARLIAATTTVSRTPMADGTNCP
jgi:hypothetical protein